MECGDLRLAFTPVLEGRSDDVKEKNCAELGDEELGSMSLDWTAGRSNGFPANAYAARGTRMLITSKLSATVRETAGDGLKASLCVHPI